jgi:thiosulfate dehydrogenase (quinone) large subunit
MAITATVPVVPAVTSDRTAAATGRLRAADAVGVLRLLLGLTFLWAFVDKLLGLGFATPAEGAWIRGGSPVAGFLGHVVDPATGNPLAGFFGFWLENAAVTNVLFMAGLLGIGLALTLGIATRVGATAGAALLVLMWLAAFPIATNPVIDAHLIQAMVLVVLAIQGTSGERVGLGRPWTRLVRGRAALV